MTIAAIKGITINKEFKSKIAKPCHVKQAELFCGLMKASIFNYNFLYATDSLISIGSSIYYRSAKAQHNLYNER